MVYNVSKKSKWQDEIGDIIRVLKEEPFTTKDLTEKVIGGGYTDSDRKRISRHLKKLDSWRLVEKEGKKWRWFEHIRSFESKEDYEQSLNHSRKLMEEASEIGFDYDPLYKHIRTGYSEIYEVLEETEDLQEKVEGKEKRLEELVIEKIKERRLISKREKALKKGSINQEKITEILLSHSPNDRPRPDLDDIDVDDRGWIRHHSVRGDAIASSESVSLVEVKELMQNIVENQQVRSAMKSFNQVQDGLQRKKSHLDGKFSYLKRKVEHGQPLEGSCSLCPKINIKSKGK